MPFHRAVAPTAARMVGGRGFALSGFHIVPDYRRPRNEDPIIESQRFSFLPRYPRYRGEKGMAISTLLLLRFLTIGTAVLRRIKLIFCFAYLKKKWLLKD